MTVLVKICGLSTKRTLEAAIEAGASYAGFVFFGPSPRNVSLRQAARLARLAEGHIKTVALTVNATDAAISAIMSEVNPAFLQLHGDESLERIAEIRSLTKASIIKAIKAGSLKDVKSARPYEAAADIVLFDARAARSSPSPGGNGRPFNWAWIPKTSPRPNFMLSGGLNSDNLLGALATSGALAVDVSSGIETAPGVKTPFRIRKFIETAKSFRPALAAPIAAE